MAPKFKKNKLEYFGMYRGKVLDITDILEQGRIKVEVYPMFAGIEAVYIPWAVPAMPLFDGAGKTADGDSFGSFSIPRVGTFVFVFFEAGDVQQPVYFAEAQTATYGIPASATTNYPDRKVKRTVNGVELIIDDTEDAEEISATLPCGASVEISESEVVVTHSSGSYAKIDSVADGTLRIVVTQINIESTGVAIYANTVGDLAITVAGDTTITADGDVTITADQINLNP